MLMQGDQHAAKPELKLRKIPASLEVIGQAAPFLRRAAKAKHQTERRQPLFLAPSCIKVDARKMLRYNLRKHHAGKAADMAVVFSICGKLCCRKNFQTQRHNAYS